jgi:hypothetical protein
MESVSGIVAGTLGLAALSYAIFGPVYRTGMQGTASISEVGLHPLGVIIMLILLVSFVCQAIFAVLHNRIGKQQWRVLLGISTTFIVLLTLLSLLSIGILLIPGTLFSVITFALSFAKSGQVTAVV